VLQRCVVQGGITFRNIGWITGNYVEATISQGGKPGALKELDACEAQRGSVCTRGAQGVC